jgi:hypothetical protein
MVEYVTTTIISTFIHYFTIGALSKQKVPRKIHVNTASEEEKEGFKKRTKEILLDNLADGFTALSLDESFFFYDSFVRRLWIYKDSRPVIRITGSFTQTDISVCMFGAICLDNRQTDIPRIQ